MKIKKSSWHYRCINYLRLDEDKNKPMPVCEYCVGVALLPFFWAVFSLMHVLRVIMFPIWWPIVKLEDYIKNKQCPFGNVEPY